MVPPCGNLLHIMLVEGTQTVVFVICELGAGKRESSNFAAIWHSLPFQ